MRSGTGSARTVNIDELDSGKWEQITKMPAFPQLDIIILTEHHLSAKFRPDYIVESGWDILMVVDHQNKGTYATSTEEG